MRLGQRQPFSRKISALSNRKGVLPGGGWELHRGVDFSTLLQFSRRLHRRTSMCAPERTSLPPAKSGRRHRPRGAWPGHTTTSVDGHNCGNSFSGGDFDLQAGRPVTRLAPCK